MAYMDPCPPNMARRRLAALLARSNEQNSTAAFRSAIEQAIGALDRNELASAATIIGETCANVSGQIHDCDGHASFSAGVCLLQADERSTRAYSLLDELRFRFGYLYVGRIGNNVMILRG